MRTKLDIGWGIRNGVCMCSIVISRRRVGLIYLKFRTRLKIFFLFLLKIFLRIVSRFKFILFTYVFVPYLNFLLLFLVRLSRNIRPIVFKSFLWRPHVDQILKHFGMSGSRKVIGKNTISFIIGSNTLESIESPVSPINVRLF